MKKNVYSHQIKTLGEGLYPIQLEIIDNSTKDFVDTKERTILSIGDVNFIPIREVKKLHAWLGRYLDDLKNKRVKS